MDQNKSLGQCTICRKEIYPPRSYATTHDVFDENDINGEYTHLDIHLTCFTAVSLAALDMCKYLYDDNGVRIGVKINPEKIEMLEEIVNKAINIKERKAVVDEWIYNT